MFKCKGKLNYYTTWLLIDVDGDICKYYRVLAHKHNPLFKLNPSKHGTHITAIAGKYEIPANQDLWKKYQGEVVDFEYNPDIISNDKYFWLEVKCNRIEDIREELGLPRTIIHPWHLTIGNTI